MELFSETIGEEKQCAVYLLQEGGLPASETSDVVSSERNDRTLEEIHFNNSTLSSTSM